MSFKTVSVIGLGYIGLPTAAAFAARKIKVIGVDVNQQVVDTINQGRIHIVEPDLDIVVHSTVSEGYLKATTLPEPADAFLIAVPTPFKGNHEPDLRYIESAANAIAPVLEKGNLVVLESTSPVGATEQLAEWLAKERPDLSFPHVAGDDADINIAHCPERVLPGHVMRELVENDRIIGGLSSRCSERSVELYKIFVRGDCIVTKSRTAEMCKLTENSFRDVNIAFANELSLICDEAGINVWELIKLANRHPRVNILQPGPGVGGHCIAVDPWFIVDGFPSTSKIIRSAREVNDIKPKWVIDQIKKAAQHFDDPTISFWGITFKPDIDDLRESPSLKIVEEISDMMLGDISIIEPNINRLPAILENRKRVSLSADPMSAMRCDIVVFLVKHSQFITLSPNFDDHQFVIDTIGLYTN